MPEKEIQEETISSSSVPEIGIFADTGECIGNHTEEHPKTKLQETIEFFRDLAIIFVVVIFVRSFIAAPFQISGSSMEESYHDGEFILVNKFSYADF